MKNLFTSFFEGRHERSLLIYKNIVFSFILKGGVAVLSLLLVPLVLNYLDKEEFGVWTTLTSIVSWFYLLDIGLANEFRNRFTGAMSKGDFTLAKRYISTTYALITLICGLLLIVVEIINPFLDWNQILNSQSFKPAEFSILVQLVFISLCLKMVLSILTTSLMAVHKVATAGMFELLGTILTVLGIYLLSKHTQSSLLWAGAVFSLSPVFILALASVYFYKTSFKAIRPEFSAIDFSLSPHLFGKGVQFFIVQLASMFMFLFNNVLIAQLFGPAEVTPFSIVNKLFSIPTMAFTILITPFWSGFSEAFQKGDYFWIHTTIKKLKLLWAALLLGLVIFVLFFDVLMKIWISKPVEYPFALVVFNALFVALSSWNSIYVHFLNGSGIIRLQFYIAIVVASLSIPCSLFLCKYQGFGIEGIMLSNLLCLVPGAIIAPIQYQFILSKKARGIWSK